MPDTTDTQPEQRLIAGRYRLLDLIGHGAMGTVWRAYDEFLHRPVAVKEVRIPQGVPQAEADELRERTMREARAIAVLTHPNVVTLHDIAQVDGYPYLVMELVTNSSLAQLLRDHGPLDTPQVAAVADAVAAALQAAHRVGITHRDVKPANVLIGDDGRIKLADFGIARNVSERTLTSTGITLGSPAYIAPEVASGGGVTSAADLWGLGATLFAAAEGRAPYDPDGDVIETLLQVVNGEVPQPTVTGPVGEVIAGLMIKDAAARMPLAEVRRRLYPLLPAAGESAFSKEAVGRAESRTAESPTRVTTTKPEAPPPGAVEPAEEPAPALATDPGPLPFVPSAPPPRRRGLPRAAVLVVAALLFLVAAVSGFALARLAADRPLLPAAATSAPPRDGDGGVTQLVEREGTAQPVKNGEGGRFRVQVPADWTSFVEERFVKGFPPSTRVLYTAPDGRYQLTVERFSGYYPGKSVQDYKALLVSTWQAGFHPDPDKPLGGQGGPEPAVQLVYKTVESEVLRRTTFANALPHGSDLWVVGLTVPTAEEDTGKTELFDRIAPTFTTPG